jgi:uncharacterized protein YoaH (UPF0181 family)
MENVNTLFELADSVQFYYDSEVLSNLCISDVVANVDNQMNPDAIIFPNPAQNSFFIQFQNMQPQVARVYSTSGVLVHEQSVSAGEQIVQINTESLASGMYIVQVGEVIRRVVVK